MNKYNIAIVGFGSFGKILAAMFAGSGHFNLNIVSSQDLSQDQFCISNGIKQIEKENLINMDIIFPAVPISVFKSWLEDYFEQIELLSKSEKNPQLLPLIVEVCSVNYLPSIWIEETLGESYPYLSSHPLFGLKSTANGTDFAERKMIVSPSMTLKDDERSKKLLNYYIEIGLTIINMSPQEHDKKMARTQAYRFLVGRIGDRMGIKSTEVDTPNVFHLLENQRLILEDSEQLFYDMFTYNPFAQELLEEYIGKLKDFQLELNVK